MLCVPVIVAVIYPPKSLIVPKKLVTLPEKEEPVRIDEPEKDAVPMLPVPLPEPEMYDAVPLNEADTTEPEKFPTNQLLTDSLTNVNVLVVKVNLLVISFVPTKSASSNPKFLFGYTVLFVM